MLLFSESLNVYTCRTLSLRLSFVINSVKVEMPVSSRRKMVLSPSHRVRLIYPLRPFELLSLKTYNKVARFCPPAGGGGTPLYGLYRYVLPQRVWSFSRFGHKLGIDFCTLVFNSQFGFFLNKLLFHHALLLCLPLPRLRPATQAIFFTTLHQCIYLCTSCCFSTDYQL